MQHRNIHQELEENRKNKYKLRNEWTHWLHNTGNFEYQMTLTFPYEVRDLYWVKGKMGKMSSMVSRELYGRHGVNHPSGENKISFVAAVEKHLDGSLHAHILVEPLRGKLKPEYEYCHLPEEIRSTWVSLTQRNVQMSKTHIRNQSDHFFQCAYCTKDVWSDGESIVTDFFHPEPRFQPKKLKVLPIFNK